MTGVRSAVALRLLFVMTHGRLDVWHWMRRITKLLRDTHQRYGEALVALSKVVYRWDEDGISAVDEALRDGGLNTKKHSPEDIHELNSSGVY